MIWFISDTHFHHEAILRYCRRPFDSLLQMNERIIDNWNTLIAKNDEVYHLGDFAFASAERIEKLIKILNGKIHFIRGNHDRPVGLNWKRGFMWVRDYYELKVNDEEMDERQRIVMSHYPIASWNGKLHGAWMLHGHSHGNMPNGDDIARIDVGVDCHDFKPISYERVKELMTKKVFKSHLELQWQRGK